MKEKLGGSLLDLIDRERRGEDIDRVLFRQLVSMLTELGRNVYEEHFEARFLELSGSFYSAEAQGLL